MTNSVSVVGIGCRFPGEVRGPEGLWTFLEEGRSAIECPPPRLNNEIPDARGGYIADLEYFDYEFFGVSRSEALQMDPQQRVFAETVYEALLDAGIDPQALKGSTTGVFAGAMDKGWNSIADKSSAFAAIGSHPALMANRISFFYDLKGPSMTCDVSCSASLAAVYYAVMSLQVGDCDLAIAGGVNILLLERFTTSMAAGGFLSKDFQCFTFDERANGYVQSEGCGVVILRRSTDVLPGERVYGEILGQSFNEDGRTGCISTPSGSSQSINMRRAMQRAGVKPSDLEFIQAHGTGTGVGDPLEIGAILDALAHDHPPERAPIPLHSIKQNLGHMELAAGIGSLIATLMILRKGVCPANILVRRINPVLQTMLDESSARFEIPTRNTPLRTDAGARLGLLGAFGYGGTNVHMVVRANHDASPASAMPVKWKRQDPLTWVCPAFIRKDDPSLVEGGALAAADSVGDRSSAPDEPVIDTLMTMLRDLVPQERLEASHSLHDLGLDSLSITELVRLVQRRFGVVLDIAELVRADTSLSRIADIIAAKRPQADATSSPSAGEAQGAHATRALNAGQLRALAESANLQLPPGTTDADLLHILDGLAATGPLGTTPEPANPATPASTREKQTLQGYLSVPSAVASRKDGTVVHHLVSDETLPAITQTNRIFFIGFYLEMLKAALAERISPAAWYIKYVHLYHILQVPSGEAKNVRLEHWLDHGDDYAWVTSAPLSHENREGAIFVEPDEETARIHACVRTRLPGPETDHALQQRLTPPAEGLPPHADSTRLADAFDYHITGETIIRLMERYQNYRSSVEAKDAWFSNDRALLHIGASGDRRHMALPTRVWDASVLACQVACLSEARLPVRVVDVLEDIAIDESHRPSDEYWIYAVADSDERPRYPSGVKTDSATSRKSWANVWVFTNDGRIVTRMRQRMVQIHDVDLTDIKLWTEPRPSALLLRLWQLEDALLRRVVRSLLMSTIAFSGQEDVTSLDTSALIDQDTMNALQHRILSVLGVPVITRTRSTYDEFIDAVADIVIKARPEQALQEKLLRDAALDPLRKTDLADPIGSTGSWVKGGDVPGSAVRLFCLPYGSGSAESYDGWQEKLEPNRIEVRPIQMPGRAERGEEAPIERVERFLEFFEKAIESLINDGKPYALYGQSMGGAIAYAWIRHAQERGLPLPTHVFVAGFPAFHLREHSHLRSTPFQLNTLSGMDSPRYSDISALGAHALAEMLALTGWLRSSRLSRCVDALDILPFLPRIIADNGLARDCVQRFASWRALPNGVGLTAFHAEFDDRVAQAEAEAWTEIAAEPEQARFCLLPGQDHFFCDSQTGRELVFEEIASTLSPKSGNSDAGGHTLVLFPGQGSQGQQGLVEGLEGAPEWRLARDVLGYDLLNICKEAPAKLSSTRICQAAVYVASYLRWKQWAEANAADAAQAIFAGFSLGEITALTAAGVLSFEEGMTLVRVRGEAMEKACRDAPSTMLTLIGLPRDSVLHLVNDFNLSCGKEVSWLCNELWDEGIVVGVLQEQTDALQERAHTMGARTIELDVEGAFHTPLMRGAQDAFARALSGIAKLRSNGKTTLRGTVYSNVTGAPYRSISEVIELLPQQICTPVCWSQVLTHVSLLPDPITSVLLPAPGDQLAGILKRKSHALYSKRCMA